MKKDWKTIALTIAYALIAVCLIAIVQAIDYWWASANIYMTIIQNVLIAIASIFGISSIWEIAGKKMFSRKILHDMGIRDNLINSGINHYYRDFKNINWNEELINVKKMTVFFAYGATWRNSNLQTLENFSKYNELLVVLPNPENKVVINELDQKFSYGAFSEDNSEESTSERILKATKDFQKIKATVKYFDGCVSSTYYLMQDKCIFAPFKHYKEKGFVPAIKCTGGYFFEFCKGDVERIVNASIDLEKEVAENENK